MFSMLGATVSSGARYHIKASTAHVEKGQARGGVYSCMVPCLRARCTWDVSSMLGTMSAARISTIPLGSTMSPSAGSPWQPRVRKVTYVCPVLATRSNVS